MGYYIDFNKITLEEFQRMLESTYLLPSQQIIAEDISERFQVLQSLGINNMQQLQQTLKNKDAVNRFSEKTSLPVDYLTVLRRMVNSYHPQPRIIKDYTVLSIEITDKLERMGIKTTPQLYDKVAAKADRNVLKKELDINDEEALLLARLADISRIRYVNPAFASLLLNSAYDTVIKIRNADYREMYEQLVKLNKDRRYYKGRINLKDMEFLINDTDYIPLDIEYEYDIMRIIKDNKINLMAMQESIRKPALYGKSTAKFWDDEYISEQMLKLHLDPEVESASKTEETIAAETSFIINWTGMDEEKAVLDLGCGPGLYVKKFAETGAKVKGIDLSQRSIDYANRYIKAGHENIYFTRMNYLDIDYAESFDIATLIFYDFCALNSTEQNRLLDKIHRSLKSNGVFIFDVVTVNRESSESTSISIWESGFWSPDPYVEIMNTFIYEKPRTEGTQYTIIAEDGSIKIIRLYHRLFEMAEIQKLLNDHHFKVENIYNNLKGESLTENSETYGIIARKAKKL